MREFFNQADLGKKISEIRMPKFRDSVDRNRGFAHVTFSSAKRALKAIKKLNQKTLGGRQILLSPIRD